MRRAPGVIAVIVALICCSSFSRSGGADGVSKEQNSELTVRSFVVPGYPPIERQAFIGGDVSTLVHVAADGSVTEVSAVEGPSLLQEHVVDALKHWTFANPSQEPRVEKITFRFSLAGKGTDSYTMTQVSGKLPGLIEIVTNPPARLGPDVVPSKRQ
jgi:hypothetical protein